MTEELEQLTNKIPVSVGIPFNLLQEAKKYYTEQSVSRSDYIVQALREKIEREREKCNQ